MRDCNCMPCLGNRCIARRSVWPISSHEQCKATTQTQKLKFSELPLNLKHPPQTSSLPSVDRVKIYAAVMVHSVQQRDRTPSKTAPGIVIILEVLDSCASSQIEKHTSEAPVKGKGEQKIFVSPCVLRECQALPVCCRKLWAQAQAVLARCLSPCSYFQHTHSQAAST